MRQFVLGALVATSFAIGVFFLRYWRESRDRFFLFFALAFWTFAAHWCVLAWLPSHYPEYRPASYLVRLAAFALILAAIVDKNRR